MPLVLKVGFLLFLDLSFSQREHGATAVIDLRRLHPADRLLMSQTKAIGLTEARAIYHVRCIETRRTSGVRGPSCYCMDVCRSCSGRVRFPPPPPSTSTSDESGRKAIGARVRGRARVCESEDGERGKIRTEV